MKKVDLNVDIGEGFPYDEALLDYATSANVCCGEHAGSWELTLSTLDLCRQKGVRIGMHPGFPDRESMGRRMPEESDIDAFAQSIEMQVRRFEEAGGAAYIKPHGAWYNVLSLAKGSSINVSPAIFGACGGVLFGIEIRTGLPAMLLKGCAAAAATRMGGGTVIEEGFADRAYLPNGSLMPRSEPGAVLRDPKEIKDQVLRLAPEVDSICLHGDTPGCLEFAQMVRRTLEDAGYEVGY